MKKENSLAKNETSHLLHKIRPFISMYSLLFFYWKSRQKRWGFQVVTHPGTDQELLKAIESGVPTPESCNLSSV